MLHVDKFHCYINNGLMTNMYIHAELHGASSTVIKNHKPDNRVPPLTLNQARSFALSRYFYFYFLQK